MDRNTEEQTPAATQEKSYEPPKVASLGSLADLTKGGGGDFPDTGGGNSALG